MGVKLASENNGTDSPARPSNVNVVYSMSFQNVVVGQCFKEVTARKTEVPSNSLYFGYIS